MRWENQMSEKFGKNGYTEIYDSLYETLKNDSLDPKIAVVTAKRLTDAIWDLHLVLNTGPDSLKNTVNEVENIIHNRLKGTTSIS